MKGIVGRKLGMTQLFDEESGEVTAEPEDLAEGRSIYRADRESWDEGMAKWYGSRENAIEAVRTSQIRRREGLAKSRLPFLHVDTREQDWARYAETIRAYWGI